MAELGELSHLSWRDDMWLQVYGINPLNVLDYFALSPFYDRACSNEVAKQKGVSPQQLALLAPGIEYSLRDAQPPHLFVICQSHRTAPGATDTPQAFFYVLDGTVYQAPTLSSVIQSRLQRCLCGIQATFLAMRDDLHPLTAEHAREAAERAERRSDAAPRRWQDRRPDSGLHAVQGGLPFDPDQLPKVEASFRHVLAGLALPLPANGGGRPADAGQPAGGREAKQEDAGPGSRAAAPAALQDQQSQGASRQMTAPG